MADCLFCRIASREQPADIVHATEHVVAFRDLKPEAPTHILIIPREHLDSARSVRDRHGRVMQEIVQAAAHLARSEGVDRSGWRLVTNVGADAGQSVHHLHFHLLGGRPMAWPPG